MREVTKEMIKIYNIKKLKYDFMGYTFVHTNELSFHHLIVPKKDCKAQGLGTGYLFWNGAILNQETSHDYLHAIERIDRDMFLAITAQMIEENENEKIDIEHLKKIRDILLCFERDYSEETNGKGQKIIKPKFIKNRININ